MGYEDSVSEPEPDIMEKFTYDISELLGYFISNNDIDYASAEEKWSDLELELKSWGFNKILKDKIDVTKQKLKDLKSYTNRYNGYQQHIQALRISLGDLESEFAKNYGKYQDKFLKQ